MIFHNFLFQIFNKEEKFKAYFFIFLNSLLSLVELISLGLLLPLLTYFLDDKNLNILPEQISYFIGQYKIEELLILILVVYLIKNIFIIYSKWWIISFSTDLNIRLSTKLFKNYLRSNLFFHLNNHSSYLVRNVLNETHILKKNTLYYLSIFSEFFIIIGNLIFLSIFYFHFTFYVLGFFIVVSLFSYYFFRDKFLNWGSERLGSFGESQKILIETFSKIKEIIIYKSQDLYLKKYKNFYKNYSYKSRIFNFSQIIPKNFFEIFLVILVFLVLFYFPGQVKANLVNLSLILICFSRIFPSFFKMYGIATNLKFGEKSFKLIINDLNKINNRSTEDKISSKKFIKFEKSIKFENVSFGYTSEKNFKNLNFEIKKNTITGLIGLSGKGKSTISYILMGLINPDEGKIFIDDKDSKDSMNDFQKLISYLPQEITLEDVSIKENLISDENQKLDFEKITKILSKVQLNKFTNETFLNKSVGEKGLKLSGGERQRLLLARALYRDPKILILDEFTSNLDADTEKELLKTIIDLKKEMTIVVISHSNNVKNICDKIVEV